MKIPKTLKIAGHTVEIEYTNNEVHMNNRLGNSFSEHNSIQISKRYPQSQREATLLHEVIHHILDFSGYRYTNDDQGVHCEKTVEALAQGLYQVFSDNKLKFN